LIQVLPVEAGTALGVAVIGNEKNQMDGLLLALGELFPGQNIGGEHATTAFRVRNRGWNVNSVRQY
jgi:hypothetical protein